MNKIQMAVSRLMVKHPFYSILVSELARIVERDIEESVAYTDGYCIALDPKKLDSWEVIDITFLLCHEVLHCVLEHCSQTIDFMTHGRGPDGKPFDPKRANRAQDLIINGLLVLGGQSMPAAGGLYDPQLDVTNMNWVDVYLLDKGGDNWDTHDWKPGKSVPSKGKVERALVTAANAAKSMGLLPRGIDFLVDEVCTPQISWSDQVRSEVIARAGRDEATWSRPNRRRLHQGMYTPGVTGIRAGVIVVYEDTSGSISKERGPFRAEMGAIIEDLNPEACYVGSVDYIASEPVLMEDSDSLASYVAHGGGGTNMPAVFDKLKECGIDPDVVIILTDGYTPWGEPPPYSVIWVCSTEIIAPYGRTIRIKV